MKLSSPTFPARVFWAISLSFSVVCGRAIRPPRGGRGPALLCDMGRPVAKPALCFRSPPIRFRIEDGLKIDRERPQSMDWNDLKIALAVARHGSLSAAA